MSATPTTPDSTTRSRLRWKAIPLAAAAVLVIGAIVGAIAILDDDDDPSRQDIVAELGAAVMPFNLEATTHVFDATATGGIQTVVADDPADGEQVDLIRSHLREEVERFRTGDFGDPEAIHGHDMPGLAVLEANADGIEITYSDLPDGGRVTYLAGSQDIVDALHDWFAAQLSDHGQHAGAG